MAVRILVICGNEFSILGCRTMNTLVVSCWRWLTGWFGSCFVRTAKITSEGTACIRVLRDLLFHASKCTRNAGSIARKSLFVLLAVSLTITQIGFSVAQAQVLGDDIDFDPPVIDHESLVSGVAGELQVFSALVVDDRGLERVTLYYRGTTGQDYQQVTMQRLSATDNYTASVDSGVEQQKIEYYIEALDTGGNRVLKGFPFFPLVRVLEAAPVAQQIEPPAPVASATTERNTALYIVLGVLAAGLIAGLAGGSNSGGGGGEPPVNTVPLTINVSPP